MGVRVDEKTLRKQLEICNCLDRTTLPFHKAIFDGQLPYTIGGGIGQSRTIMFLLQTHEIASVQPIF